MKLQLNFFKRRLSLIINKKNFSFHLIKKPTVETAGITSRCQDMQHVLFLDYDEIERWIVEDELRLLQHYYKLTPFYLFTTEEKENSVSGNLCGNYHAICLTKMPIHTVSEIQDKTHIDWKYRQVFRISRYKSWVLRSIPKGDREPPKYLGLIGKKDNLQRQVSQAHLTLLKAMYDVDDIDYEYLDKNKKVVMTSYKTSAGV